MVDTDEGVRADTSMEALAKLKPVLRWEELLLPATLHKPVMGRLL